MFLLSHRLMAATDLYMYFYLIVLSPVTAIYKFYSFITFNLLINAVNLLLNCLVLIPCLYIHLSLSNFVARVPL